MSQRRNFTNARVAGISGVIIHREVCLVMRISVAAGSMDMLFQVVVEFHSDEIVEQKSWLKIMFCHVPGYPF